MLSKLKTQLSTVLLVSALAALATLKARPEARQTATSSAQTHDWPAEDAGPRSDHYSVLAQINRGNVKTLQLAWTFDTREQGGLETSPLVVDGILYGITPTQKIFALDAATGKLLWRFDSGITGTQPDRGLSYWTDGHNPRILVGIMNFLYALDARDGKPIPEFARNGRIDLRENLDRQPASAQSIFLTSPGVVFEDTIIVGGRNPESLPAPPGNIRAFDVRTGTLRWSFHTIPHPQEEGYDTWPKDAWKYSGAANNWAGMSLDTERGILYVPTGSAAMDFYGADRLGDDLFSDCLIALDARTGKRIWHFQAVRHDLWDRDFPAPPVLLTVTREGKKVDAVAQTSKQGFVYLFERTSGRPLFPIGYKKYPPSDVPGEVAASEQPLPLAPAPFARQNLSADLLSNRTPEIHLWALAQFQKFRSDGPFVPFSVGKDTVVFPGFDGGAEWGGAAVDRPSGILYLNSNDVAWTGALAEIDPKNDPKSIYLTECGLCHGENRKGSPPLVPALEGIGERRSSQEIATTIKNGKGRMPGFANLDQAQLDGLVDYLLSGRNQLIPRSGTASGGMKYYMTGYHKFLDPDGYPAVAPPWGTLNAIDLNTGAYLWRIPFGDYPELAARGLATTGTENYGGPIVTAGGLLFIGATNFDRKFRAFDTSTGELLWQTTLPFSGNATPATYEVRGRQFVVIAAGGGKDLKSRSGGIYLAFALATAPQDAPGNRH